jgi:hypothetical protein
MGDNLELGEEGGANWSNQIFATAPGESINSSHKDNSSMDGMPNPQQILADSARHTIFVEAIECRLRPQNLAHRPPEIHEIIWDISMEF